jgi:tetratricopeptide (TPR) repeat protein
MYRSSSQIHPGSAPASRSAGKRPLLLTALLVILAGAAVALGLYWRHWSRPGQQHYRRGLELMSARDPAGALQEWTLGIESDPTDPACFEMVADFYAEGEKFGQAAALYERATQLSPKDGELFGKLADCFRRLGRQKQAVAAAEKAAKLLPQDGPTVGRYGLLLKGAKRRMEALEALRRSNRLTPNTQLFFMAMVDLELEMLQIDQAERDLTTYLKAHPDDAEAHLRMADVYNRKRRTPETLRLATDHAEKAVKGLDHDTRAYTLLGQLFLAQNRTEEALRLYTEAHQRHPTAESLLRGLADCYTRLGRSRELAAVSAEYQQVLKRHDRIDHLTHLMSFNPRDVNHGLELARLSEEEGMIGKAQDYYEQFVRQDPKAERTRKALSGFYARAGRPDLARRALQPTFLP